MELGHFHTLFRTELNYLEKIPNTVAEYLSPQAKFLVGDIDEKKIKLQDLREYRGMKLSFASSQRMFFSDSDLAEKLYPEVSDRVKYGGLPFTGNRSFHELKNLRVLIVDHETGENGGIITNKRAQKLVGDGAGKISPLICSDLIGDRRTPFQYRMGIKPQQDSKVYRIGKGTLAPDGRLSHLTSKVVKDSLGYKTGYDLVLPTANFKGRSGADKIQPGEYNLTIGLGVKSIASYGPHSLGTQVLVNYPLAVEQEIFPAHIKKKATLLAEYQTEPAEVARACVKNHEEKERLKASVDEDEILIDEVFGNFLDAKESLQRDEIAMQLMKTDLENHSQLIEMPFFMDRLKKFTKNSWRDFREGRSIKFQSGLAQPSLDLKKDEVCIPIIPDGEEVIVTRSPLINSNGVIVLKNKHLPQLKNLFGCVHIHPETAATNLQGDFDGDRLAYELASKYPLLTAEIKEALKPENRYPEVLKLAKIPYQGTLAEIAVSAARIKQDIGKYANQLQNYVALRTSIHHLPEREFDREFKSIRKNCQKLLHRDNQLHIPDSLKNRMDSPDGEFYQKAVSELTTHVKAIASLPDKLNSEQRQELTQRFDRMMYLNVGLLQNELQVAADGPKSARRPNEEIYQFCAQIPHQKVSWIAEKKELNIYDQKLPQPNAYDAISNLTRKVNEIYRQSPLEAKASHKFREFFPQPTDKKAIAKAQEIKEKYNSFVVAATQQKALKQEHPELGQTYLEVTSLKTGRSIYLTDIDKYAGLNNPVFKQENMPIRLENNPDPKEKPLIAMATVEERDGSGRVGEWESGSRGARGSGSKGEWESGIHPLTPSPSHPLILSPPHPLTPSPPHSFPTNYERTRKRDITLGAVAISSLKKYPQLKAGTKINDTVVGLYPPITEAQIKSLYRQADEYARQIKQQYGEPAKQEILAGALWWSCFPRQEEEAKRYLKGNPALKIFPKIIEKKLRELQFKEIKILGTHLCKSEYYLSSWQGEKANLEIKEMEFPDGQMVVKKPAIFANGKLMGYFPKDGAELPVGTKCQATLQSHLATQAKIKTPRGNELTVTGVNQYAFKGSKGFEAQDVPITILVDSQKADLYRVLIGDARKPLGNLNQESIQFFKDVGYKLNQASPPLQFKSPQVRSLHSAVTATIEPSSVVYPWKEREKQRQKDAAAEAERTNSRQIFVNIVKHLRAQEPRFQDATPEQVDKAVASLVYRQTKSSEEVVKLLAQGEVVSKSREGLPPRESLDWLPAKKAQVERAQNYVSHLLDEVKREEGQLTR